MKYFTSPTVSLNLLKTLIAVPAFSKKVILQGIGKGP